MRPDAPPPHEVRYEREILESPPDNGWRARVSTPNARASCTCGRLDTGMIDVETATRAAQEHVQKELPGVSWE